MCVALWCCWLFSSFFLSRFFVLQEVALVGPGCAVLACCLWITNHCGPAPFPPVAGQQCWLCSLLSFAVEEPCSPLPLWHMPVHLRVAPFLRACLFCVAFGSVSHVILVPVKVGSTVAAICHEDAPPVPGCCLVKPNIEDQQHHAGGLNCFESLSFHAQLLFCGLLASFVPGALADGGWHVGTWLHMCGNAALITGYIQCYCTPWWCWEALLGWVYPDLSSCDARCRLCLAAVVACAQHLCTRSEPRACSLRTHGFVLRAVLS